VTPPVPQWSADSQWWWDGVTWVHRSCVEPGYPVQGPTLHHSPAYPGVVGVDSRWCPSCQELVHARGVSRVIRMLLWLLALPIIVVAGAVVGGVISGAAGQNPSPIPGHPDIFLDPGEFLGAVVGMCAWVALVIPTLLTPGRRCPNCRTGPLKGPVPLVENWSPHPIRAPAPRRRSRGLLMIELLLVACLGAGIWGYFNPNALINPPTTWDSPTDVQLQAWQTQVRLVQADRHSGGFLDLFPSDHPLYQGSGFFIGPHAAITALHVLDASSANEWFVESSSAQVGPEEGAEDVATLSVAETAGSASVLPVDSVRPARGQHLWLLCATGVDNGVQVSEFNVIAQSAAATLIGPPSQYVQDEIAMTGGVAAPGCSGAPLVDGAGRVVGMADGAAGCDQAGDGCQLDAVPAAVFAQWVGR
jgi:hypothetical protein